jgi:hypothetical protein
MCIVMISDGLTYFLLTSCLHSSITKWTPNERGFLLAEIFVLRVTNMFKLIRLCILLRLLDDTYGHVLVEREIDS